MFEENSIEKNEIKKLARDRENADFTGLDEEQAKKYEEIIDLLLAGGYFRVRIQGLSWFDKVIGGMAWCITSSNVDLDIDLSFQEEASIGQKIKMGENIIRALQKMKCPHRLEPNQIQGGANTADFVNILPVIKWLIKTVLETRSETGDLMRQYSEFQFNKNHILPQDFQYKMQKEKAISFIYKVNDRYKPSRKYKKPGRRVPYLNRRSEEENVQLALLEYGEYYKPSSKTISNDEKNITELEKSLSKGKKKNEDDDEQIKNEKLKKELKEWSESKHIDQNVLDSLIDSLEKDEWAGEIDQLTPEQQKELFGTRLHQQNINKLERDIQKTKGELNELNEIEKERERKLEELQIQYNKKQNYNQRIIIEMKKLDELETPENTKHLQMLKLLVSLNENLKHQEIKFKQNCKKQLTQLKEQLEKLQKELSISGKSPEEQEIEQKYNQSIELLKRRQQLRSKRARDIVLAERKIDEIPSRTERTQYQRQFVELYEQVDSKFLETRQYYNSFNTLEDTKTYLSKELSILNSIHDTYKQALNSKQGNQFLESLQNIVKSVAQSIEKIEQKLNIEKENKNKLTETYNSLIEKERLYFRATKEFLEECQKNEILRQKLESKNEGNELS